MNQEKEQEQKKEKGKEKEKRKEKIKILAIGDVVGMYGVNALKLELSNIIKENSIDFCIVNAENSEEGLGISKRVYKILDKLNIDCITLGDHTWNRKEVFELLENEKLLRPANYPEKVVGKGYYLVKKNNIRYLCISLLGRAFINQMVSNPFEEFDKIYEKFKCKYDICIVDFHAEASAEKIALFKYISKRVNFVFGTHTHIQTADEKIENGCGYITDTGMCGKNGGVIGMDTNVALKRQLMGLPEKYKICDEGDVEINGTILTLEKDEKDFRYIATDIKRMRKIVKI